MLRAHLKIVAFPLAVLGVFGLLYAIWLALDLPPEQTIIEIAQALSRSLRRRDRSGISAYLEGLLLIGWYFPGTLVIICRDSSRPARTRRALVAARGDCGSLGLFAAYVTNFFAGKFGWYRLLLAFGLREPLENAQRRLTRYGLERDLHDLLAGQSCVVHLDRGRHPAVSRRALRSRFRSSREAFWITLLGDADLLPRQRRALACGLPHDPVR